MFPRTSVMDARPACPPGNRLWIRQKSERADLDAVWDTRVPGAGDYPK